MGLFKEIFELANDSFGMIEGSAYHYIKESIEKNKLMKLCGKNYFEILDEIEKVKDCKDEIESLKASGHTHIVVTEAENKILQLIEDDPRVLRIIDKNGNNIPYLALKNDLLNVAKDCLIRDKLACTMDLNNRERDDFLSCAIRKGIDDIVYTALNDDFYSTYQNEFGQNMGMIAAYNRKIDYALKALDNPIASTQQDDRGQNIGLIAAILCIESVTMKALDNETARRQQDEYGRNIGIMSSKVKMKNCISKALDDEIASCQQDEYGRNLGMYCAIDGFDELTMKALDNFKASTQQDDNQENIGMFAARNCSKEVYEKAKQNPVAVLQLNLDGERMSDFAKLYGKEERTKSISEDYSEEMI